MKKLVVIFLLCCPALLARVGCLHNSLDLEQKKYDYKEYHPVDCTCPCEEQHIIYPNGMCSECRHRRDYVFVTHVKTDPSKLINIVQLRKYARK